MNLSQEFNVFVFASLLPATLFLVSTVVFSEQPLKFIRLFRGRIAFFCVLLLGISAAGVSRYTLGYLPDFASPVFLLMMTFLLSVWRLSSPAKIRKTAAGSYVVADMSVLICFGYLLKGWTSDITSGNYLGKGSIILFPFLYLLPCIYMLHNFRVFWPDKYALARWRLLAFAFPESSEHKMHRIGDQADSGLRIRGCAGVSPQLKRLL